MFAPIRLSPDDLARMIAARCDQAGYMAARVLYLWDDDGFFGGAEVVAIPGDDADPELIVPRPRVVPEVEFASAATGPDPCEGIA